MSTSLESEETAIVIGVDLSGPANVRDTAAIWLSDTDGCLSYKGHQLGADDPSVCALVADLATRGPVVVGLDAPLSYNPGGGSRPADQDLRRRIIEIGMRPGSVMSPTATRMAYLTLRGLGVARLLSALDGAHPVRVVEVHPGAVFGLGGAPLEAVMSYRTDSQARRELLKWLAGKSLVGLPPEFADTDHLVTACGAALATWNWSRGQSSWLHPAEPPHHPYDFAC